ncbi:MAG: hypothetical protein COU33_00870 [Candidatus Magasanikbacteria bacterium CG10_big_fil_rev_8_21_14_0_10_43_6]|uniref:Uncharacterized protein n=1 Tax=Candidatus Magasanikbacteria bacterium CG10_big_fil_rev_8_21_14_0_10_43_6 TaxID=1974650 RepID=A0A2M6W242_9BACT|nr:MAG: hypothetical protein COU33_00870 [Candidatus Magasanikbacteria bacterium CG10_big_fil_rev_8_21_14_0_10_43_6]
MPIEHTRLLFERLCRQIPPLVPDSIQKDMSNALEQVQDNVSLTLEELEDTVVSFGKKLWPYREAFLEFYRVYEGHMGETFLMQKMSPHLKKKYRLFKEMGGTFRDFHEGGTMDLFTSEDRVELCEFLVDVNREIWEYTVQKVLSTDRLQYEDRIKEFETIFEQVEKKIDALHTMADDEQEHPELAAEIREHIRGFEQGVSLLGPKVGFEALCEPDYFEGRRQEKKMLRHV